MELNKQLTMEEEAIKRNTDCVYFLASPLTCKKGSECEYRHSETARINPRDCWFWMNGNCLNPKCAFRHPPLDGLVGPPVGVTSAGPSLPPQPAALIQTSAPQAPTNSSSKQTVPCFYFQKGLCLKGDKCPFMHGSQAVNNPAPQQTVRVGPVTDPLQTPKKPPNEPLKPTFQQKSPPKFFVKSVEEIAPPAKPIFKPEISPDDTINVTKNTIPVPINDEFITRSKPNNAPVFTGIPAVNRPRTRQTQPLEDGFPDGEESDEFLGESSPGFDVLVDDELEDSNYFLSEDIEYRRSADHGRRDLSNSIGEFDYGRHSPVIVDSLAKFDRDPHLDLGDYEFYGRVNDRFGWEQRRASSERILERSSMPERRGLLREESPNQIGGSDLRHRLSKRKRVNGSRFDDHRGEFYRRDKGRLLEEDRYKGRSRRDPVHFSTESSMSKRLQGRITLSSRSSGDKTSFDSNSNREIERGRNWGGRLSPARPSPYLGRLHERITRRTPDEISTATEGRNFRCQQLSSRDDVNFAGPKSLAELKNAKSSATLRSEVVHDKHKGSGVGKVPGHQESENTHSFEGPKPLSVILKRKRETGFGNGTDLSNIEVKQTEREDPATEVAELQPTTNAQQPVDFRKAAHHSPSSNEELKGIENMVRLANEGIDSMDSVRDSQSPIRGDLAHLEEDLMMEEGTEDQEIEGSDQRDGESDEGNWKMEEVNGDPEDEFLDDEDGDDFARRLGVMFS